MLTFDPTSAAASLYGNLSVTTQGPATAHIRSTDADASLYVNGGSTASAVLNAASTGAAKLRMGTSTDYFDVAYSGDTFSIQHEATPMLSVSGSTGDMYMPGNLTVGGNTSSSTLAIVKSIDTAQLSVEAGATGSATISALAAAQEQAKLVLTQGANTFSIANDGALDELQLSAGSSKVVSVSRATGATSVLGNLSVGNAALSRPAQVDIVSNASASMSVNGSTALVRISSSSNSC